MRVMYVTCIHSVVIFCSCVVCAGVAHGQPNKAPDTRIQGTVMVSPARPGPVTIGSEFPNAAPLPNATFRVTSDEGVVTTFTTDTEGHFRVFLKAGHYSVVLSENRFPKPCGPFEIMSSQAKGRSGVALRFGNAVRKFRSGGRSK